MFVVIADFYRHNRPLFTFGSAAAITIVLLVSFALTPRADDLSVCNRCNHDCRCIIRRAQHCAGGGRAQLTAVPPCGSTLGSDSAYSRRWPTTFRADLTGPAGLDRRGRRWSCDPHGIAIEDIARGRGQTGGRASLHEGAQSPRQRAVRVRLGHYLIFHDAPRSRIFFESIFEAYYPPSLQSDFAAVYYALPGARACSVTTARPNDFVLMPAGSAAYGLMTAQTEWRLIYRDPVAPCAPAPARPPRILREFRCC